MSKKTGIITAVIAVISLICSAASMAAMVRMYMSGSESATQYVMYVGTNDKDTYQLEHTKEEAMNIVDEICLSHFDGYTIQEATGSWMDEKNNITHEYTIVCYFDGADRDTVYAAADEIIEALNQNTVLIEEADIRMDYYGGESALEELGE